MKCKECKCCQEVTLSSWSSIDHCWVKKNVYQCWGVKEPFVIKDTNVECTEYPEYRNKVVEEISIEKAIEHFKYGISHDIFKEPVTSYAKMAVGALEKQTPKKPLIVNGRSTCPSCGFNDRALDIYCDKCGQKLDWD